MGKGREQDAVALLARIYEVFPLICTNCGGKMSIIASITEAVPIRRILRHIGESDRAPETALARDPPGVQSRAVLTPDHDISALEPTPEFDFDQTVNW